MVRSVYSLSGSPGPAQETEERDSKGPGLTLFSCISRIIWVSCGGRQRTVHFGTNFKCHLGSLLKHDTRPYILPISVAWRNQPRSRLKIFHVGTPEGSQEDLGGVLGRFGGVLERFGGVWGHPGAVKGRPGAPLGRPGPFGGPSWGVLGRLGAVLGRPGAVLGLFRDG